MLRIDYTQCVGRDCEPLNCMIEMSQTRVGCTLAPPGEYHGSICVTERSGLSLPLIPLSITCINALGPLDFTF